MKRIRKKKEGGIKRLTFGNADLKCPPTGILGRFEINLIYTTVKYAVSLNVYMSHDYS